MPLVTTTYTLAVRALALALPLLARGEGKIARGVRGRRGVLERMRGWAARRDPARPLVWFHAPSVGEGLQARAVMEALRELRPDVTLVFTYFSPSAEAFARSVPADFVDYLPWDLPEEVASALDLLRPDVLAFSKYDVWPNLVDAARRDGTRVALLSATLPPGSSRLRYPARAFLRRAYRSLDRVAAISRPDAERFARLGVPAERRTVMGDARFDQVWRRARSVELDSDLLRPLQDPARLTLVAGSTWPADEERLLSAWTRSRMAQARLLFVPHEPTSKRVSALGAALREAGLSWRRLSEPEQAPSPRDALVVDRVGILGDLYALADVAYVGGAWGRAGIHSVLEPAAFGIPVLYGPRHTNAREAAELVERGGGYSVSTVGELRDRIARLIADPDARRRAGDAARRYVEDNRGAARRGAAIVAGLLGEAPGPAG